jgi:hypothetical protein
MWRAFLRGLMAATLVVALLGALVAAATAPTSHWDDEGLPAILRMLGMIGLGSLVTIALFALFPGWLFLIGFRRLGLRGGAYAASGTASGVAIMAALVALSRSWDAGTVFGFLALGAVVGAATGFAWGLAQRPRRLREVAADPETPRRPAWAQPEPLKVRPFAFVMGLGVIGFAVAVAAAGEGRFDRLPPQQYFAPGLWRQGPLACAAPMNDFQANWYSTHLRTAREPSLYLASQAPATRAARTYRFTWLRSFHEPVIIRLDERSNGVLRLTAKRLNGKGGYGPGNIAARVERDLTPDETHRFERLLSSSRLFRTAAWDCQAGADGAEWVFEANDRGAYLFHKRWTPERGPMHDVGLLLLGFTGWRFDPIY